MTVTLKKRKISDTKWTWVIHIHAGKIRRRESTGLFFDTTKTRAENREVEMQAQAMQRARYDALKKELRSPSDPRLDLSFSDYFLEVADREMRHSRGVARKVSASTQRQWRGAAAWVKAWEDHTGTTLTISDIDTDWLNDFKIFLMNSGLKPSSQALIWSKLGACLDEARHEKIIEHNPALNVKPITMPTRFDTEYLTDEELARLIATPIRRYPDVARAFVWSCLTSQRPCDVRTLRHDQIRKIGNDHVIVFKQQKTGKHTGEIHVPISAEAVAIISPIRNDDTPIFNLPSHKYINEAIAEWCEDAGINRKITYKASRHTFCTRLLKHTGNLAVVQAAAGHKDLKSTQRYLHIVNKDLHDAVNTLPSLGISNVFGVKS